MADIELVIKMPEKTVNEIKDNAMFVGSISSDIRWDITSAIVNGTPLPDNATNGDMLKAMFPNIDVRLFTNANIVQTKIQEFDSHWWNAPYKRTE